MENDRRDEVIMGLVYRARTDAAFRSAAHNWDPERLEELLLGEYRYELRPDELQMCKTFARSVAGVSEQELDEQLAAFADPIEKPIPINPFGV